jgi:type IV pilus assembly protein PilC
MQEAPVPRVLKKQKKASLFAALGTSKEREYLVENLSMLVSSGMPIVDALESISKELETPRMKTIINTMKSDIESGAQLWETLSRARLFPQHAITLIKLGEESGNLAKNLKVVAVEQEKNRIFESKVRSAMMYPVFVLALTFIVGVGIAWFILPKLATVFAQLKIALPLITKVLIGTGVFLGTYGYIAIPALIVVTIVSMYLLFFFSKTKFIGQRLLFSVPGIRDLIKEIELARFGYLLGTLLEAGIPIDLSLESLASATEVSQYKKLYTHVHDAVEDGNSIQASLASFKGVSRLIPAPIQQIIATSEQSGTLAESLLKIGMIFENKADTSTKNLAVILEPVLLVIVWLGVVGVALAVVLPIYSLVGGFNAGTQETSRPVAPKPNVLPVQATSTEPKAIVTKPTTLRVLPTPIGYLNVRDSASRQGKLILKVKPGEVFEYTDTAKDWFKITLPGGTSGWVVGTYVKIIE